MKVSSCHVNGETLLSLLLYIKLSFSLLSDCFCFPENNILIVTVIYKSNYTLSLTMFVYVDPKGKF